MVQFFIARQSCCRWGDEKIANNSVNWGGLNSNIMSPIAGLGGIWVAILAVRNLILSIQLVRRFRFQVVMIRSRLLCRQLRRCLGL